MTVSTRLGLHRCPLLTRWARLAIASPRKLPPPPTLTGSERATIFGAMSGAPLTFVEFFAELNAPTEALAKTVRRAFEAILGGSWTPVQVAAFAISLRLRGETSEIIAAAAEVLRAAMVAVDHDLPETLDTCGTGGDGLGTLNLSSAGAIVVAAMGVKVAKHGNRAATSRTGSADVFEALGVPLDIPPAHQAKVLREAGIAFLFAPAHHPAMRHGGVARRELGIRTIFNVLGPLANPARATHQLLGAYDDKLRPILAETLRALGTKRAWIVRGADGLDEMSPTGPTYVTELDRGSIIERTLTAEDFGLERCQPADLRGGDAGENAAAILSILRGEAHPARTAVVLNAAAAYVVASEAPLREAAALAEHAIASGAAYQALERWKAIASAAKEAAREPAR